MKCTGAGIRPPQAIKIFAGKTVQAHNGRTAQEPAEFYKVSDRFTVHRNDLTAVVYC
jgi:hypothetical protein